MFPSTSIFQLLIWACSYACALGNMTPVVAEVLPQLDDAWRIAKERFLADLDDKERALFDKATLENLFYTSSNDQKDDSNSSKSRSVVQKLQPLISAVQDYGASFDTLSNIAPLYLAPIWGSIRIVLVLARNHGKFYDRITDTFERIGDLLPRFRECFSVFSLQFSWFSINVGSQVITRGFSMEGSTRGSLKHFLLHILIL
jgi:hypothetical protein